MTVFTSLKLHIYIFLITSCVNINIIEYVLKQVKCTVVDLVLKYYHDDEIHNAKKNLLTVYVILYFFMTTARILLPFFTKKKLKAKNILCVNY